MMKPNIAAGEICVAVFHLALLSFGHQALEHLEMLHLATSDAIGRAVFGLVDVGLLRLSEDDRPEDFVGLPSMADLWCQASQPAHDWYPLTQKVIEEDEETPEWNRPGRG